MNNYTHNVEDLKREVWALKKDGTENKSHIQNMEGEINQILNDIEGLNGSMSSANSSVSAVQTEVNNLKTSTQTEIEEIRDIIDARAYGMSYLIHVYCKTVGSNADNGYIDFQITDEAKIRIYFGLINSENSVTFTTPFSSIIWAMSSDASTSDSKSHRSTIKSLSTTGVSFYGGAAVMTRYEVWGIIVI